MSDTKQNGRYLCVDALSCLGVIALLFLQYIQKTGFLEISVDYDCTPGIAIRWFCLSGAMLLSACMGYVLSEKPLSWHSYKPLLRLTYIYSIASLCSMLVQKILYSEEMTISDITDRLLHFTTTDTARIIAMYAALLLAAPFLSAAFRELKTFHARLVFLAISAAVSTLQPMLMFSGEYLLPQWCKLLAPVAGFIGGAFVREYAKQHNRFFWFMLLLLVGAFETGSVVFICTQRGMLYYPQFDSMASLPSLAVALLLLCVFHSDKPGESGTHSFFAGASGGALAALLMGGVLTDFLMPSIFENFPDEKQLVLVGLLAVPVVFILCCTIGLFLQLPVFLVRAVTGDAYEYEEDEEEDEDDISGNAVPHPNHLHADYEKQLHPVQKSRPIRTLEPIQAAGPDTAANPVQPDLQADFRTKQVAEPVCKSEPKIPIYRNPDADARTSDRKPKPVRHTGMNTAVPEPVVMAKRVSEPESRTHVDLQPDLPAKSIAKSTAKSTENSASSIAAELIAELETRPNHHHEISLEEILNEQGITSHKTDSSIDELIARITK